MTPPSLERETEGATGVTVGAADCQQWCGPERHDEEADDFDMAKVMAMFENLFPAGPEPDPARLLLAKTTANSVLPAAPMPLCLTT